MPQSCLSREPLPAAQPESSSNRQIPAAAGPLGRCCRASGAPELTGGAGIEASWLQQAGKDQSGGRDVLQRLGRHGGLALQRGTCPRLVTAALPPWREGLTAARAPTSERGGSLLSAQLLDLVGSSQPGELVSSSTAPNPAPGPMGRLRSGSSALGPGGGAQTSSSAVTEPRGGFKGPRMPSVSAGRFGHRSWKGPLQGDMFFSTSGCGGRGNLVCVKAQFC